MKSQPSDSPAHRPGDLAKQTRDAYRTLSLSSVGLEMGIAVILGLLLGRWLDGRFGTTPWLLIVFTMLGMAAGMKGVFRAVRESDKIAAENEANEKRGGS
jgi:ATP synthase protein I